MAWTSLSFSVGQVLTAAQMNNLQANFAAVAGNEAGAPVLLTATNVAGGTVAGTFNVGNTGTAIAGLAADDLGTYAFLRHETLNTTVTYGTNYAGSLLTPTGFIVDTGGVNHDQGGDSSRSGTWKCLGNADPIAATYYAITLFLKVAS